jgi:anti-sigma regulatory factor (Ser/Thr protein kinase)
VQPAGALNGDGFVNDIPGKCLKCDGARVAVKTEVAERFEAVATQAAAVRRFVRGVMKDWGIDPGDVVLLANELATNAVVHARGPFDILVGRSATRIRVSVRDDNTRIPDVPEVSPDALSGRGLAMVVALAADWGIDSVAGCGKTIWFEVDIGRCA